MENTGNSLMPGNWYKERTDCLSGFMTEERSATLRRILDQRTRYMTVLTENMFHPQNASAIVRHCDAFGLQDIHAVEKLCRFKPNVNIVKGTDKWITLHKHSSTSDALDHLKHGGYRIIATSPHESDTHAETFDISAGPFALVFGTEHEGISKEVADRADGFIKIPMWGFVESLNVSACAAIIIYILSQRLRESGIEWSLSTEEKDQLLYEWMMRSVKDSKGILARNNL